MPYRDTPWFPALAPYVQRDDLTVALAHPFLRPTGERVAAVPSVFVRFPPWLGAPLVNGPGKKSATVDLDGEQLFAELAILRLLARDGWQGRWIFTTTGGEVSKYLTDWRDVPRKEQTNRPIQDDRARALLYAIADRTGNRYGGLWDVFAWRDNSFVFFEAKRQAPRETDTLKSAEEAWVRAALSLREQTMTPRDFALVQWDYRSDT